MKHLAQREAPARILVRSAQKAEEVEKLGLEAVPGDVTNTASIEAALQGVDKVFLLTPVSPNEAELKIAIIDTAIQAEVEYLVLLSGAGASSGSPISQAQQHAESEAYLKASGLAFTILQPYFFMQNFVSQAASIKTRAAIYGNSKDGKIAMVDIRDIAAVAAACLTKSGSKGQTYIITGGEAITYADAAEAFSAVIGRKVNYVDLPSEELIAGLIRMGTPAWLASDLAMLGENFAAGHFAHTTEVVEEVAKKRPITFDQFSRDNAQAFR